ncbi:MAG: response regulator [Proteobacteria bacterium]|nr:response regulator [Pseudomonadota bacterium]
MARVLIVEDDLRTSELLRSGLAEAGHAVEAVGDGELGLAAIQAAPFDLIILDALLPKRDGWQVLEELRRQGCQTPVLMLSALDGIQHRVRGLSLGADDYLTKPFSFEELNLRVNAICRRLSRAETSGLGNADVALDEANLSALRDGEVISLTMKEFALLKLLLTYQGAILSKQYIAKQVWDIEVDSESNVVEVNIRRLRQKLDDPFAKKLIYTLRGRGYVLR